MQAISSEYGKHHQTTDVHNAHNGERTMASGTINAMVKEYDSGRITLSMLKSKLKAEKARLSKLNQDTSDVNSILCAVQNALIIGEPF